MYSDLKSVQIIISLLKKYKIKNIVISAGTRHTPLVHSLENDTFFNCYSIVDERSASFFAIGLIEYLQEPVAICSTSGTAAANYMSAANEAFYQQLPLLILTADRNPYYLFQQEEQMIPQINLFKEICKKTVTLPIVRDDKDFWFCSRIVNEALLELNHREKGPVHINFPIENDYPIHQGLVKFSTKELPDVKQIMRLSVEDEDSVWKRWADKLSKSKILIVYGQSGSLSNREIMVIDEFCIKYNCIISADLISNLHAKCSINSYLISRVLSLDDIEKLVPDIIITMNGSTISDILGKFSNHKEKFEHWHVSKEGIVSDPLKILPNIVESSPLYFFKRFTEIKDDPCNHTYYDEWIRSYENIERAIMPEKRKLDYSALYATQQLMLKMPADSLFHIANSNSIRLANYFKLDKSINVYCNRGTNGIDGSMSSFIGQSFISDKTSFLLIGDLSFFYDMNSIWNKYVSPKARIMVINNSGGSIFHNYPGKHNIPTINQHIAAEHTTSLKEWVISRGFDYISAENKKEFDSNIDYFMRTESSNPILFEVFTSKEIDTIEKQKLENSYREKSLKGKVSSLLPNSLKKHVKRVIK